MIPTPLAQHLARIEKAYPKATITYARIIVMLAAARDRTMSQPDLSEALGHGRDSSAVQKATERLARLGIVTRELLPAGEEGGKTWNFRLAAPLDGLR